MKTSVLIGLSRHRIGVDGAGVTMLVAFHTNALLTAIIVSIHKHCHSKGVCKNLLLKNCTMPSTKTICIVKVRL